MDYYIHIKLNPDAEMRENVLLNKVYTKLHKALFDLKADDIGISFPQWKVMLGRTLRLHSTQERLVSLQAINWLGGLVDYCNISDALPIPYEVKHRTVSRIQTTMSQSKLNRLVKRGSISRKDTRDYRAKMFSRGLDNPYVELTSGSNGHKHRRYIAFGDLLDTAKEGQFDQFGLSNTATVPWF